LKEFNNKEIMMPRNEEEIKKDAYHDRKEGNPPDADDTNRKIEEHNEENRKKDKL
jgi:hypothetical protein